MSREPIPLPAAEADLVEAFEWYEGREPGLGFGFLGEVGRRLASIRDAPEQFDVVHKSYRRALFRRFPCALFFRSDAEPTVVHAVMHAARRPIRWRSRQP